MSPEGGLEGRGWQHSGVSRRGRQLLRLPAQFLTVDAGYAIHPPVHLFLTGPRALLLLAPVHKHGGGKSRGAKARSRSRWIRRGSDRKRTEIGAEADAVSRGKMGGNGCGCICASGHASRGDSALALPARQRPGQGPPDWPTRQGVQLSGCIGLALPLPWGRLRALRQAAPSQDHPAHTAVVASHWSPNTTTIYHHE